MKFFKRKHNPVKVEKSRALIKERMTLLRKVPSWSIEPLEVIGSFQFFYIASIMLLMIFLMMGKGHFLSAERLIGFAVFLAIFAYVGKTLRTLMEVVAFELPEYAMHDILLNQTFKRISIDNTHLYRVHSQVFDEYLDTFYADKDI